MAQRFAFLASTRQPANVGALRDAIGLFDERRIWIAERDACDMSLDDGWSALDIVDTCLDAIDDAERFFLVIGAGFGSRVSAKEMLFASSFTELELFYAVVSEKPLYVFQISGEGEESDLAKLVQALSFGIDEDRIYVGSTQNILDQIRRLLDLNAKPKKTKGEPRRLLSGHLASERHSDFSNTRLFDEIEFLGGSPIGVIDANPDLDLVRACLIDIKSQERTDRKMSRAWLAIRLLMGRHYRDVHDPETLALWEEALRAWSQFAGWRGLHSHLWLGHISALGSLHHVREVRGENISHPATEEHGGNLFGAFASVYYSLAKSGRNDHQDSFLKRSLAYLSSGIETVDPSHRSGLYSIRAAVRLYQGVNATAVRDFEEAIRLHESHGGNPTTALNLEVDLGFAEVRAGRKKSGLRRIEAATKELIASDAGPGFKIRSLRKLAIARFGAIRPFGGYVAARDAARLIERHQILDQADAMTRAAGRLDSLLSSKR